MRREIFQRLPDYGGPTLRQVNICECCPMTVPNNLLDIKNSTLEVAAAVIASGIDPKKSILFNQSKKVRRVFKR